MSLKRIVISCWKAVENAFAFTTMIDSVNFMKAGDQLRGAGLYLTSIIILFLVYLVPDGDEDNESIREVED